MKFFLNFSDLGNQGEFLIHLQNVWRLVVGILDLGNVNVVHYISVHLKRL